MASAKTQNNQQSVGLEEIAKHYVEAYQRPDAKHTNLKRLIKDLNLWKAAYSKIKGNKGSKTPGHDKETISDLTLVKIRETQTQVLNGTYK